MKREASGLRNSHGECVRQAPRTRFGCSWLLWLLRSGLNLYEGKEEESAVIKKIAALHAYSVLFAYVPNA